MVITTGDGNKLPNPATDGAFNLVIYNANDPFVTPEIVRVTAKSGDSLTITRAQEGTTATNKTAGNTWFVELVNTAKMIQNIDTNKVEKTGDTMTGTLTATKLIPSGNVTAGNGMYLPAANTVAFSTNGAERVRVDASGNLGINTTQGISKLQVNNIGSATSFFSVVGGEAIVSGNSVTVSKTQRGILHIENNQNQSVGRNASLTFGLGGSQFINTYHHISGAIRTETTGSGNLTINPKMVFSVLDGASTTGTLVDRLEISHTGAVTASGLVTAGKFAPTANTTAGNGMYLPATNEVAISTNGSERLRINSTGAITAGGTVTAGKLVPTANTTAGNGMYLPTTNQVAIGTDGTEAMRIDASQRVIVGATTGTMRFNVQNSGIVGGTERTPNASGTTVSIYTITCPASSDSTRYNIANGVLKVSIGSRSTSHNAVATYTLPFMLSRIGRSTGIVTLTQGTPTLLTASTSSAGLDIDTVTVALSSDSNTGATLDITVTTSGSQAATQLDFNSSLEITQQSRGTAPFTIVPA
jgi:hypothetical protein